MTIRRLLDSPMSSMFELSFRDPYIRQAGSVDRGHDVNVCVRMCMLLSFRESSFFKPRGKRVKELPIR
jgi:hypothetical protein